MTTLGNSIFSRLIWRTCSLMTSGSTTLPLRTNLDQTYLTFHIPRNFSTFQFTLEGVGSYSEWSESLSSGETWSLSNQSITSTCTLELSLDCLLSPFATLARMFATLNNLGNIDLHFTPPKCSARGILLNGIVFTIIL